MGADLYFMERDNPCSFCDLPNKVNQLKKDVATLEAEREHMWVCPCCRQGNDIDVCEQGKQSGKALLAKLRKERDNALEAADMWMKVAQKASIQRDEAIQKLMERE
jgi:hypothetical protein